MASRMVAPETPAPALSASSSANSWEVVASDDDDGADVTGEEDDTPPHESDTRERRTEQTPSCSSDSSAGSAGASAAMRRLREAMVAEGTREEERTTSTPKRKKKTRTRARASRAFARPLVRAALPRPRAVRARVCGAGDRHGTRLLGVFSRKSLSDARRSVQSANRRRGVRGVRDVRERRAEENAEEKKTTSSFDVFPLSRAFPASTSDAVRDVRGVRAARQTPSRVDRFKAVGVVRDARFRRSDRKERGSNAEAEGVVRAEPFFGSARNGANFRNLSKPRAFLRGVRPSRRLGVRRRRRARARSGGTRRRRTLHVARRHERDRRRRRRAIRRADPTATPVTGASRRDRTDARTLDRERLRRSWCDDALRARARRASSNRPRSIVESWSRGVVS